LGVDLRYRTPPFAQIVAMGVGYVGVQWNRQKIMYDIILWSCIILFVLAFILSNKIFNPNSTDETLIIRATAITAFLLLHIILSIGPLCRLNKRFLPLLYNRRHMGVSMFMVASVHGIFSFIQFHTLGDTSPIVSLFTSNTAYREISEFPFQTLGFVALLILSLLAITSHDFWLKTLSPRFWKSLHMSVYMAYTLIVIHVATGALQYESHPIYFLLLTLGFIAISSLHIASGVVSLRMKRVAREATSDGYFNVGNLSHIHNNEGITINVDDLQIAVFKHQNKVSAVGSLCKHQMGPIGEGRIVDGCITCPWHGYQYDAISGHSPPPFNEQLEVYPVKVIEDSIWIKPEALEYKPA